MRIFLLFLTCMLILSTTLSARHTTEVLFQRMGKYYMAQHSVPSPRQVKKLIGNLKANHTWPDIKYASNDKKWLAEQHLRRILTLALAYSKPGSQFAGNSTVRDAIINTLNAWMDGKYKPAGWWHRDIGTPLRLASILFVFGEKLPSPLYEKLKKYFYKVRMDYKSTGQNRLWMSQIILFRGLIFDDLATARKGRNLCTELISYASEEQEGLQPDFSYHQHGPQLQFGNYGRAFIVNGVTLANLFEGTSFALSPQNKKLLLDYLVYGPGRMIFRGEFDLAACARYILPGRTVSFAKQFNEAAKQLQIFFPQNKSLQKLIDGNPKMRENRFYNYSDFMMHRREDYYCSIRMCSSRVVCAESSCSENLKGLLMSDGLMLFRCSNLEYKDIAVMWDWRRLPGITAVRNNSSLRPGWKEFHNRDSFVGGISNGTVGLAALKLNSKELSALKSYMCFDRYIVCIGSSIVPKSKGAVETTVNSIWLRPKFIFNLQNGTNSKNPPDGNYSVKSISHDNLEYIFPQYASINLDTSKRTGSWRQVVGYMSDTPVKGRLFTLYLKHKVFPANYYYIIRPLARSASPGFIRLEASSPDIHAGIDTQANLFMGSFFVPGKVKIPGMGELTLVTPALVLIQNKKISLCAPDWKRPCIKGFWSGKPFECKSYNGQSVSYTISDSGLKAQSTAYALKQPVSSKY